MNYSSTVNKNSDGPVDDLDSLSSFQVQWVVATVIYIVVFVVGVLGNALVLWVTVPEVRRSVKAIWFLNLAVADLLCCLALPIHIMTALKHGSWLFDHRACSILMALFKFSFYASVLLLLTISADRFLLVFKPDWCQKFRVAWWAWQASVVAWMLALVLTIPYFVFGVYVEDALSKKHVCVATFELGSSQVMHALTMMTFLVPLVTMSVCYVFLLLTCCRKSTRSTKTLKVVVAMVTSFFFFWLPSQLSFMLWAFYLTPSSNNWQVVVSLQVIGKALASVNCCINPIIYMIAVHIRVFKFQPDQLRQLLTEDYNRESRSHPRSTVDSEVPGSQTQV